MASTMFHPNAPALLRAALGKALEFALERALALDPETRAALHTLDGRELELALQSPTLRLRLIVQGGRIQIGPGRSEREADLHLTTTLGAMVVQMLSHRSTSALPLGQLRVSGDAEFARRLQQLQQNYHPDFEEAFARVFGDVAGVQFARALQRGLGWSRETFGSLAQDTAEFLAEESRDLVPKAELDAFLDAVDHLRDDVERIERRILRRIERNQRTVY